MEEKASTGAVFLLVLLCCQGYVNSLDCYICSGVDDPRQCTTIQSCYPDETCFVVERMTYGSFKSVYDLKCESKDYCNNIVNSATVMGRSANRDKRDVSRRKDFCHACCTTPLCNRNACVTSHLPTPQVPLTPALLTSPASTTVTSPATSSPTTQVSSLNAITKPQNQIVLQAAGAGVTFSCKVSHSPSYTWYHTSYEGVKSGLSDVTLTADGTSVLKVDQPSFRTAGKYTCVAHKGALSLSLTAVLTVPVHVEPVGILKGPANTTVHTNDLVVLPCVVYGMPTPSVGWFFKHGGTKPMLPPGAHKASNNSLVIPHVTSAHEGDYSCVARTGDNSVTVHASLTVQK